MNTDGEAPPQSPALPLLSSVAGSPGRRWGRTPPLGQVSPDGRHRLPEKPCRRRPSLSGSPCWAQLPGLPAMSLGLVQREGTCPTTQGAHLPGLRPAHPLGHLRGRSHGWGRGGVRGEGWQTAWAPCGSARSPGWHPALAEEGVSLGGRPVAAPLSSSVTHEPALQPAGPLGHRRSEASSAPAVERPPWYRVWGRGAARGTAHRAGKRQPPERAPRRRRPWE